MTKARALQLLERHVSMLDADSELRAAVDALRPRPRAVPARKVSPAVRTILRELKRPDGWGLTAGIEQSRYLDTFGAPGSPERERQERRLQELERGPSREAFGAPVRPEQALGEPWDVREQARKDHALKMGAWETTDAGLAFAAALEVHEARARQFGYTPLKQSAKPDEIATYVRAFLGEPEQLSAAVAA